MGLANKTDITLSGDIPRISGGSQNPDDPAPLTIPAGKTLTIDLNGYTLDTGDTVITVSERAKLTIENNPSGERADDAGTITNGGGIRVEGAGPLTIQHTVTLSGYTAHCRGCRRRW